MSIPESYSNRRQPSEPLKKLNSKHRLDFSKKSAKKYSELRRIALASSVKVLQAKRNTAINVLSKKLGIKREQIQVSPLIKYAKFSLKGINYQLFFDRSFNIINLKISGSISLKIHKNAHIDELPFLIFTLNAVLKKINKSSLKGKSKIKFFASSMSQIEFNVGRIKYIGNDQFILRQINAGAKKQFALLKKLRQMYYNPQNSVYSRIYFKNIRKRIEDIEDIIDWPQYRDIVSGKVFEHRLIGKDESFANVDKKTMKDRINVAYEGFSKSITKKIGSRTIVENYYFSSGKMKINDRTISQGNKIIEEVTYTYNRENTFIKNRTKRILQAFKGGKFVYELKFSKGSSVSSLKPIELILSKKKGNIKSLFAYKEILKRHPKPSNAQIFNSFKSTVKTKDQFAIFESVFSDYLNKNSPPGYPLDLCIKIREYGAKISGVTAICRRIKTKYGIDFEFNDYRKIHKLEAKADLYSLAAVNYRLLEIEKKLAVYPGIFFKKIKLRKIYIFSGLLDTNDAKRLGGFFSNNNEIAVDDIKHAFNHEIFHCADFFDFGLEAGNFEWGIHVHGANFSRLYGKKIVNKLDKKRISRPKGYPSTYSLRSVDEFQAEVASWLLSSPNSYKMIMQWSKRPDEKTLKKAIYLVKAFYYRLSDRKMDDKYWSDFEKGKVNSAYFDGRKKKNDYVKNIHFETRITAFNRYRKALRLINLKKYSKAVPLFKSAIKLLPLRTDFRTGLIYAYILLGKRNEMLAEYKRFFLIPEIGVTEFRNWYFLLINNRSSIKPADLLPIIKIGVKRFPEDIILWSEFVNLHEKLGKSVLLENIIYKEIKKTSFDTAFGFLASTLNILYRKRKFSGYKKRMIAVWKMGIKKFPAKAAIYRKKIVKLRG